MGATRLETTVESEYQRRRAHYLANREGILAKAKERYKAEKPARQAAAKALRDAAREARRQEKRRALYGPNMERLTGNGGRAARMKIYLRDYKTGKLCLDCQKPYPFYVLEFDHVRGEKKRDVSDCRSLTALKAEIEKCDLVCANCHRERTFQRRTDLSI